MNARPPTQRATDAARPSRRPSRARRPRGFHEESRGGDRRAITLGIVGTLLVHLLLILLVPRLPWAVWSTQNQFTADHPPTFDIEIVPDTALVPPPKPEPPALPRFVEVNPDAPDNPPDKTPNVGAQNQQVAQEIPTPGGTSDTPAVNGQTPDSTAIVSGQLTPSPPPPPPPPPPPTPAPPPPAPAPPADAAQLGLGSETKPLPGYENLQGTADNAPGTTSTPVPAHPGTDTRQADGTPTYRIDRAHPMPRPRLPASAVVTTTRARPSPIMKNDIGTQNIGAVAYDAHWSSYGEYLQRLIDTVQVQWERLILNSAVYPPTGTRVLVKFVLNAKGEITEILKVESNGSRPSEYNCVNAIQARAPYGEWTEDMISVLGQSQEITFTFHYQ
ncbi:hypothetical protein Ga0100231_020525 [Opitutaceae bacterium TAV4]|nr:hypothetical protein Ga0100231_020525 [Opitutaceae bacterium TAV4]